MTWARNVVVGRDGKNEVLREDLFEGPSACAALVEETLFSRL